MSGSYTSAIVAQKMLKEEDENVNIHVINTLSAGGQNDLFLLKINELIKEGLSWSSSSKNEWISKKIQSLFLQLEKVDNLVKNGRLNKLVGAVIGMLNIRLVGNASPEGTLNLLHKAKGQKKAVQAVWAEMKKNGYKGGRVVISHCSNPEICGLIQAAVHSEFQTRMYQASIQAVSAAIMQNKAES